MKKLSNFFIVIKNVNIKNLEKAVCSYVNINNWYNSSTQSTLYNLGMVSFKYFNFISIWKIMS